MYCLACGETAVFAGNSTVKTQILKFKVGSVLSECELAIQNRKKT